MPDRPTLDLTFTPELRSRIETFLAAIAGYEPTLVLLKGRRLPYAAERWDYGAYRPDDVRRVAAQLERIGQALLFVADGLVLAVPQVPVRRELTGRTLGLDSKGSIVVS